MICEHIITNEGGHLSITIFKNSDFVNSK